MPTDQRLEQHLPDVHILPLGDLLPHQEVRHCWCLPRIEYVRSEILGNPTGVVVVHHSLDGRELVEQHGIN